MQLQTPSPSPTSLVSDWRTILNGFFTIKLANYSEILSFTILINKLIFLMPKLGEKFLSVIGIEGESEWLRIVRF